MQGNALTGTLPSLASLPLHTLSLTKNNFTGSLTHVFTQTSPVLTYVALDNNQLTGSLPTSLYANTRLTTLRLSGNALTGTLSSAISELQSLQRLFLDYNGLTGGLHSMNHTLQLPRSVTLRPLTFHPMFYLDQLQSSHRNHTDTAPPHWRGIRSLPQRIPRPPTLLHPRPATVRFRP